MNLARMYRNTLIAYLSVMAAQALNSSPLGFMLVGMASRLCQQPQLFRASVIHLPRYSHVTFLLHF